MGFDEEINRVQIWTTDGDEMISDPVREITTTEQFLVLRGENGDKPWTRLIPIHAIKGVQITPTLELESATR